MQQMEFQIPVGATVKLKEVSPEFYNGYACYGNVGTIKDRRFARFGYPEVFIEWDKDHWAYNGAPDGWTFESHFDLMEAPMAENKEDLEKALEAIALNFAKNVVAAVASRETVEKPVSDTSILTEEERAEAYEAIFREAIPAILDSKAFIVLALKEIPDGYVPFLLRESKDKQAELVLNVQLAHLAVHNYEDLVRDSLGTGDGREE